MKKKIFLLAILSFTLNLFWEVAHSLLYNWNPSIFIYISIILVASLSDSLYIFGIFTLNSLRNNSINWINKPSKLDYTLISVFLIIISAIVEIRALKEGRWSYNSFMPKIFGLGLSPLIQLAITSSFSLWLIKDKKNKS